MTNQRIELDALQLALKMETDGYNFFKDASKKAKNDLTKETFDSFAQWELEHIEFIKKMVQGLKETGSWLSMDKMGHKKGDALAGVKTIFQERHEKIEEYVKIDSTDLDAYKVAKDIEDKAVVFYQEKLKTATSEPAKRFYEFMIDMEREHYQVLNNSYRFFENPAQWNLEEESWMFDGG